jgi:predicted Zn-dependent peptidase
MLFKGTPSRSALEISQAIEGRGGYLNAYTQEDATCYYARLPYERLEEAFDVLADMYCEPRLAPDDIERERAVIIEELRMGRDQPQQVVQEELMAGLWPRHPLGRPLVGNETSLRGLSRAALDAFRRRHYQPRATVFAMAGRLDHAVCARLVRDAIGRRAVGRPPPPAAVNAAVPQEPLRLATRKIEQVHAALGFRCFGRHDARRYALRVMNGLLGENMSSRLFQIVRERHGLAYAVQSSFQCYADTGAMTIAAGLDRARAPEALRLIATELARLRAKPVGAAELRRTRDYLQGQFRLGLEGAGSQMQWLGETLCHYDRLIRPEDELQRLMAVSADDIQRLARELFTPERLTLALVTPEHDPRDAQAWRATLAALG